MNSRYKKLERIYNATHLIYRFELQRVAILDNKLMYLAKTEAEERERSFSTVPYQLLASRLNFLWIERLKLTEERNLDIERALRTGLRLKRISKLLLTMKQLS